MQMRTSESRVRLQVTEIAAFDSPGLALMKASSISEGATVLASDNCYLYRNLSEHKASATFSEADHVANVRNQARMIQLAGGNPDRVIPGHDDLQFQKYPTRGRIAKID